MILLIWLKFTGAMEEDMRGKIFLLVLLGLFVFTTGCLTTNWAHNKRHFRQLRGEFRQLHQDIDRLFLDLPTYPTEL
jgi:hypothetical protein